jgi:DNA polymerase
MNAVRGKAKETTVAGVPLVVFPVFHPAAALYTPSNRSLLEEDFRKLSRLLQRGVAVLSPPEEERSAPPASDDGPGAPGGTAAPADAPTAPGGTAGASSGEAEQLPLF